MQLGSNSHPIILLFFCLLSEGQGLRGLWAEDRAEESSKPLTKCKKPSFSGIPSNECKSSLTLSKHLKSFTEGKYPLKFNNTNANVWAAWHHSYIQNEFRFQRAMHKLVQEKEIEIAVIGGSITLGHGCGGGFSKSILGQLETDCSWVGKLRNMLQSTHGKNVTIRNYAMASSYGQSVVAQWKSFEKRLSTADLIISEYHVNELFDYTRKTQAQKSTDGDTEDLVSLVLNLPKKPAFLFLDLSGPESKRKKLSKTVDKSLHYNVAKRFGIPIIWYAEIERQAGRELWFKNEVHPPGATHAIIAHLIHDVFQQEAENVCLNRVQATDLSLPPLRTSFQRQCAADSKLSVFASMGRDAFPIKSEGEWVFKEDVPGKPGWIAPSGVSSEIVFTGIPVSLGGLQIEYLLSYENIGSVTCTLEQPNGHSQTIQLNGLWEECASVLATEKMSDISEGTYDLRCQSSGEKFKLTGLMTC